MHYLRDSAPCIELKTTFSKPKLLKTLHYNLKVQKLMHHVIKTIYKSTLKGEMVCPSVSGIQKSQTDYQPSLPHLKLQNANFKSCLGLQESVLCFWKVNKRYLCLRTGVVGLREHPLCDQMR